jgi:cytochrome c6
MDLTLRFSSLWKRTRTRMTRVGLLALITLVCAACNRVSAQPGEAFSPMAGRIVPVSATAPPASATLEDGRALYIANCAPCHKVNGEGNLSLVPALNRNPFVTVNDPTAVIDTVLHGRRVMPAFEGALAPQEIATVISYIRNTWNNQAPKVETSQVEQRMSMEQDGDQ